MTVVPDPPELVAAVRIDLLDPDPLIWREVEVPITMTLKRLHAAIQAAMEWDDAHLWEFAVGRERISQSRTGKLPIEILLGPRKTKGRSRPFTSTCQPLAKERRLGRSHVCGGGRPP
jgi:hypothetical protein